MDDPDDRGWGPYLDAGERVLWTGAPRPGLRVRPRNLLLSAFGVPFLGFALFWVWMASGAMSAPGEAAAIGMVFPLFGLPFVAVGLYLVAGQYVWEAYVRGRTRYALTNRRALIATNAFRRSLKSWPIDRNAPVEFAPHEKGDDIYFAEKVEVGRRSTTTTKIGFEGIDEGERVYKLIRDVKQGRT